MVAKILWCLKFYNEKNYSIKLLFNLFLFAWMIFTSSCSHQNFSIELSNELDISRQFETVEIDIKKIPKSIQSDIDKIGVYDPDKGVFLTKQIIFMNKDGVIDLLIFQPELP